MRSVPSTPTGGNQAASLVEYKDAILWPLSLPVHSGSPLSVISPCLPWAPCPSSIKPLWIHNPLAFLYQGLSYFLYPQCPSHLG